MESIIKEDQNDDTQVDDKETISKRKVVSFKQPKKKLEKGTFL